VFDFLLQPMTTVRIKHIGLGRRCLHHGLFVFSLLISALVSCLYVCAESDAFFVDSCCIFILLPQLSCISLDGVGVSE